MNEKICRLCLQTTIKNHQAIGETFLTSLETLKLNINLCKENVMCTECTDYLQVFTNFKSASFHMIDSHLIMMHNLNSLKTETKCSFCPKTGDIEDFVSLNETNKYEALVDMLKQHILDKNSNNTEELLTCEICLGTLQDVSSFISKCLEVEEKISKYMEIEGIDDKDQIELKDVQKFTLKSAVKSEINPIDVTDFGNGFDQIKKECTMTVKREVKHENDLIHQELIIKPECGDTNTEQNHDREMSEDLTEEWSNVDDGDGKGTFEMPNGLDVHISRNADDKSEAILTSQLSMKRKKNMSLEERKRENLIRIEKYLDSINTESQMEVFEKIVIASLSPTLTPIKNSKRLRSAKKEKTKLKSV